MKSEQAHEIEREEINRSLRRDVLTLDDVRDRVDAVFRLMNWYASGDHLQQWSRVDPQSILGEVYMCLAPVQLALEGMTDGSEGFAAQRFDQRLNQLEDHDREERAKLKKQFDQAIAAVTARVELRLEAVEEDALATINRERENIEAEIARRVKEELERLEDIRSGKRRHANGRVIRL